MGIEHFRLSPQHLDMVRVARIFRGLLQGRLDGEEANAQLTPLLGGMRLSDGFYRGLPGASPVMAEMGAAE